jgi:uncharacterized protein (UPF0276 family)
VNGEPHRVRVGALFNPSLHHIVDRLARTLDYLAVIPDRVWRDLGRNSPNRFQQVPRQHRWLEQAANELPIVLHSIGMSICSAEIFDEEFAVNLMEFAARLHSPWISEHLAFSRVGAGHEVNSAIPLPVACDLEMLDLLVPRVRFLTDSLSCPFLLENSVYYVRYPDQDLTEEEFLNRLCARSGCGVLLDLHNVYTNSVNHGLTARDYVDNLDLKNVQEIHIAGGAPMMGFHADSHAGPVLEGVWDLLEYAVSRAKNLRGVTFEFHESSFDKMGESGFHEQIDRTRAILGKFSESEKAVSDVPQGIPAGRC